METITVRKGNIELDISVEEKEHYKKLGYSVVEKATGKVIEEAPILDAAELQNKVAELIAENEALKQEIAKLKATKKATTKKVEA